MFGAASVVAGVDLAIKVAAVKALAAEGTVDLPGPLDLRLLFNQGGVRVGRRPARGPSARGDRIVIAGAARYAWRGALARGRAGRIGLASC